MNWSREQRLFSLFIAHVPPMPGRAPQNRLLADLRELRRRAEARAAVPDHEALSVSGETLRVWRLGQTTLSRERIVKQLERIAGLARKWEGDLAIARRDGGDEPVSVRVERFRDLLLDQGSVYDAKSILGYDSDNDVQRTLDHVIYGQRPLLKSAYFDYSTEAERHAADERCSEVLGSYMVYLERGGYWLACPARVRYLVVVGQDQAFIRFKMSVLDQRQGAGRPYDLDGVVTVRDHALMWTAESRPASRQDHLSFITSHVAPLPPERASREKHSFYAAKGRYLTMGQDGQIAHGEVVLEQVRRPPPGAKWADDDRHFMQSAAQYQRRKPESAHLVELLARLAKREEAGAKKPARRRR